MPISPPRRILVTRSRGQTSALAAQLQALGAEPILIPAIAIAPPASYAPLDAALAALDSFQWILFTSANAVAAFDQRRSLHHTSKTLLQPTQEPVSQQPPRNLRVAAIGPATAHALTRIGLAPDLLPPRAVAESFAESLLPHILPGQTRILLVRAESARDTLPDALLSAGAGLTIAPAYSNVLPEDSIPLLQQLFRAPSTWPHAITFTSSSTASNLLALLEAASLALPPDGAEGKTILRASIGPITSATLRELGYPAHIEAPQATVPALVETLASALGLSAG
ncbi:MAG: hypothetical protein NVSMB3_12320 [Acidobacteriaceae bacterium]